VHQLKLDSLIKTNLIHKNINPNSKITIRVFLFLGILTLFSCSKRDIKILKEINELEELLNTEIAEEIEILHTDSGFVKVILTAPLAITKRGGEEPYTEMPDGLEAIFFNRDGEKESTISSLYGISYENQDIIILRNKVDVVNVKNERLETEELTWNKKTKKIYTEKFVKITTPAETISGYGMEADEDFSNWVIKDASGNFNME